VKRGKDKVAFLCFGGMYKSSSLGISVEQKHVCYFSPRPHSRYVINLSEVGSVF